MLVFARVLTRGFAGRWAGRERVLRACSGVLSASPAKQWEKEFGYKYTQEDVQRTLDKGPRNGDGQPVDHRNGRPLRLVQGENDRGWVMRYDRDAGTWLPENRGLNEGGMPARGEPNSYGYDENGDLLPYANERPQYTKEQIEEVWTNSRNGQL